MAEDTTNQQYLKNLEEDLKNLKKFTTILAIILAFLFCISIYKSISQNSIDSIIAVPISLSAIVFINLKKIRKLKIDIEKTQKKNNSQNQLDEL